MRDENVHFAYDTRSGDIFWDSNGANAGGGRGLAKIVGDSDFMAWETSSGVQQIEFVDANLAGEPEVQKLNLKPYKTQTGKAGQDMWFLIKPPE